MNTPRFRQICCIWLGMACISHVLIGALLPVLAQLPVLQPYHESIERAFWGTIAPAAARQQQIWWISLFGATVQGVGIWMLGLVVWGWRSRAVAAWWWLLAGLLSWAPQDMWISWQIRNQAHVVADLFALITLLPPLLWLIRHDRNTT